MKKRLYCLFNDLLRLTTKKASKVRITVSLWGKTSGDQIICLKLSIMWKAFPSHDAICNNHYDNVIMCTIASLITSLTIVYSTVYSDADQRKHQSSASLAFVWGIHRGPVNFPHKWPVTRKMFPFDDVIMIPRASRVLLIQHIEDKVDRIF